MRSVKPLVLDVDGTFLKTDILFESFWAVLGKAPLAALGIVLRHFGNPPRLKRELAEIANLRIDLLPVNPDVKTLALHSQAAGREVVLASASDKRLVEELARAHALSGRVMGSTGDTNLKGSTKAEALVAAFGERGFDYAGDSRADMQVWPHAENALLIGDHPAIERHLAAQGTNVTCIQGSWKARDLLRALRPHQWVKNVLLLLPMIAGHHFDLQTLMLVLLGMAAFSAAASSIYVVNDLLDLEADRLHQVKNNRPFASGAVPIQAGMWASGALALVAIAFAACLGKVFLAVTLFYMALSLVYSLRLKRGRWVDVLTLAGLYTIRVIAGAAASGVYISAYMLVFVFPVFVTLGAVKRLTELSLAKSDGPLPGRGYGPADRGALLNLAMLGMAAALAVFFLYSFSAQAVVLYPTRWILWVAMLPLAGWLFRMVRLGYFGKQDHDPILFALRDKRGLGLILIMLSLMFYAAGLWAKWFGL